LHDLPALTEEDISASLSYAPDVHTFLSDKPDEEVLVLQ
jgi:uncharacterized protein (DUF433 family)